MKKNTCCSIRNIYRTNTSDSFLSRYSVDKVEVEPVIRYTNPLDHLDEEEDDNESTTTISLQNGRGQPIQNGASQLILNGAVQPIQNGAAQPVQNGHHDPHEVENGATEDGEEVDEEPPVNIITGPDWESVNYTVTKVEITFHC